LDVSHGDIVGGDCLVLGERLWGEGGTGWEMRLGEEVVVFELLVFLLEVGEFEFESGETGLHVFVLNLDFLLALLEGFLFGPLAFAGGVSGGAVTENTLDPTLLLLGLGFGAFARWEVGGGSRKFLTPRLSLLGGLLRVIFRVVEVLGSVDGCGGTSGLLGFTVTGGGRREREVHVLHEHVIVHAVEGVPDTEVRRGRRGRHLVRIGR
jgi:hypothetical protein